MSAIEVFSLGAGAVLASGVGLAWWRPEWVVRFRRSVLAGLALVSLGAAAALVQLSPPAFRMSLDPSEEPMLTVTEAERTVYREAVDDFGDDDLYVIAMTTDAGVFTTEHLTTLRRLGAQIRRLPGVRSIESLADVTTYRYDSADDLVMVQPFIGDIPDDPATLATLREQALADRLYRKTIVSTDGRTAALNVAFRPMTDGEFVAHGLDDRIATMLAEAAAPGVRFAVTGRQHLKARTHHLMVRDLTRLIPLAVVVGALVAWLATGSLRTAVIPVGASLVATLWAYGALALLGRPLNLITLVLGPTLICVGSVYGVHVLARYDALVAELVDGRAAALACLRYTTAPVLVAGVTTVIGFGALMLSDTPAIRELGTFSALGIAAVTMLSLTGIPALLACPRVPDAGGSGRRAPVPTTPPAATIQRALDDVLARVATVATERPVPVLLAWAALLAVAVLMIPRIVVDTDYLTFFHGRSEVRRDFAAVRDRLVGPVPVYVALHGGAEGAFREPANLRAVAALQARLAAVPGVSTTFSVVDLIETLNRAIEKDDPAAERIPDTRGQVADVMFLLPKDRLRRFATSNHSRANILVRTGESGSRAVRALEQEITRVIAAAPLPEGITARVTGNTLLVNKSADGIARNQIGTVGLATVAIFVAVARVFRSWRVGLLAMLPNVCPVLMFFGALGSGIATLSMPTSLIGCIALGIAVDDTAHFLVGYRRRREDGMTPVSAAADCVRALGRPIVVTSLMLVAGFLVIAGSEFATLREFGALAAMTMVICLCTDLLMLPALLVRARV